MSYFKNCLWHVRRCPPSSGCTVGYTVDWPNLFSPRTVSWSNVSTPHPHLIPTPFFKDKNNKNVGLTDRKTSPLWPLGKGLISYSDICNIPNSEGGPVGIRRGMPTLEQLAVCVKIRIHYTRRSQSTVSIIDVISNNLC